MQKVTLGKLRVVIRRLVEAALAAEHQDPSGVSWDSGLDENDEDHSDEHTSDPRWDNHADPTGSEWDSGLDS